MSKYLVLWEVDASRVPVNAKERGTAWLVMHEMLKADMKKGFLRDWGAFPGQMKGFAVGECNDTELSSVCMQYYPFVRFEVHCFVSLAENEALVRAAMR